MGSYREEIAQTVALIEPGDDVEAEHRCAVLNWIDSGDELYRRLAPDQPPMHLVSYFVPFDVAEGSILLTAHRKSGLTLPPGGHCEPDELPWQTVQRECLEELGISAIALPWFGSKPLFVTVTKTHGSAIGQHTDVSLWYVIDLERANQQLRPDPGEFDGVHWFSFDRLLAESPERFDPHLHRFARKLRAATERATASTTGSQ